MGADRTHLASVDHGMTHAHHGFDVLAKPRLVAEPLLPCQLTNLKERADCLGLVTPL